MVFDLIIKPIVFVDVEEAIGFYNKKSNELATRFYQSFLNSLEEIRINPHYYFFISKPVRRHVIKKFPYKIFYVVEENKIVIIGISHAKRSNRFIKSKLKY